MSRVVLEGNRNLLKAQEAMDRTYAEAPDLQQPA
jgi:hypothetical protein